MSRKDLTDDELDVLGDWANMDLPFVALISIEEILDRYPGIYRRTIDFRMYNAQPGQRSLKTWCIVYLKDVWGLDPEQTRPIRFSRWEVSAIEIAIKSQH